ncbi:TPA: glycosyltransferase [Enterobacter cloacae]|nr:glycosyltransferase [Enterobacter cloacae]
MRICAVVVTFNRKQLLVRSLNSIISQRDAVLNKIIIIDNASTDGTENYLHEKGVFGNNNNIEVEYVRLQSNLGGAGGFNKGLSIAFDQQYDYCWVMDDDGYPDENCLHQMLKYTNSYDFLSPLVLNELDHSKLSFGIDGNTSRSDIEEKYKNTQLIEGKANPFNGVIFSRKMLSKIGFPKSDMFIWGDENEYQQRALQAGMKIATVKDAFHFHPENRVKYKIIFGKFKVNLPEGELRQYCYFRNYTYILKKYGSGISLLKWFIKYFCLFILTLDIKGLVLYIKAASHALQNDFSHHREYLK